MRPPLVLASKFHHVGDHGICNSPESQRPVLLDVVPGMTVIVKYELQIGEKRDKDWWMGQVIHCGGTVHDLKIHNLFHIADMNSGVIRWVNADLVTHVLPKAPGQTSAPHLAGLMFVMRRHEQTTQTRTSVGAAIKSTSPFMTSS